MIELKLLVFAWVVLFVFCDDSPMIESPAGKFKGHIKYKTRNGRDIHSFEGIPYAKPPVGELRFKDPVKMPKLDGSYDATKGSIRCYQPSYDSNHFQNLSLFSGTEDCLYLNIHIPKVDKPGKPLPVMVMIHGGYFLAGSGSAEEHRPTLLLDKDLIIVAPNYRLGVLGFLSTGDDKIRGNYGLKDIVMALKWVQENIASFGGDPKLVTLAGLSSGGALTSLLMHTPKSEGLFHRAICQSGSGATFYALQTSVDANEQSKQIAKFLQCPAESNELLNCLQKKTLIDIANASVSVQSDDPIEAVHMKPVIENASPESFITDKSLNETIKMPMLTGVTSREAVLFLDEFFSLPKYKDRNLASLKKDLNHLIPKWSFVSTHPKKDSFVKDVETFYFGKGGFDDATEEQIIDFISDVIINYGVHYTARIEQGPTYLYMLSYKGNINIPKERVPKGLEDAVGHEEDEVYLFNTTYLANYQNWSKDDLDMSQKLIEMWYNFMKFGNPTPDSGIWSESEKGVKYLDITNKGLIMKSNMFKDRMAFYDKMFLD